MVLISMHPERRLQTGSAENDLAAEGNSQSDRKTTSQRRPRKFLRQSPDNDQLGMADDAQLKTESDGIRPVLSIKPGLRQMLNQYLSDHLVQEQVLQEKVNWLADAAKKVMGTLSESVKSLAHLDFEDLWNDIFIVLAFMMIAAIAVFIWQLLNF